MHRSWGRFRTPALLPPSLSPALRLGLLHTLRTHPHPRLGRFRTLTDAFTVQSRPQHFSCLTLGACFAYLACLPTYPSTCRFLPAPLPPGLPALPRLGRFRTLTDAHTVQSRPKRHRCTEVVAHFAHLPTHILCKVGPNGMDSWMRGRMDAWTHERCGRQWRSTEEEGTLLGDFGGLGTG